MLEVKICGLTEPEMVVRAQELGAAYVGFIFYPPSPRALDVAAAIDLVALVRPPTRSVGLFVDASDAEIDQILDHVPLDILQLHGLETPERVRSIGERTGRLIMKALPVETAADLASIPDHALAADMLLFDAKPPRDAAWPGGHGLAFDWHLLQGIRPDRPWALAGGLKPDNLEAAVRLVHPPIVDVSSGVESAPGLKDPALLQAFLETAGRLRAQDPIR